MADIQPDVASTFAEIATALQMKKDVALGSGKAGFGSSALQVKGKIFAMVSSRNEFVVKLPKQRVSALVTSGDGIHFGLGHGRLMKEWLIVHPSTSESWLALANEALTFVGSK